MLRVPNGMSAAILNVDDDEASRYTTARILCKAGFAVQEASTGKEALRLAETMHPDLILLDVQLPDLDGFEVCRRLKASPATASIPVLHLSAEYVSSQDRAQGLEGGADGYLVRPLDDRELTATVCALLRMHRAEQRERAARAELERLTDSLKTQRRWLEVALDLLPVPTLFLDPETAQVVFANRAAQEAAGELTANTAYYTDATGRRLNREETPEVRAARGERLDGLALERHTAAGKRSLLVFAELLPAMFGHAATPVLSFLDVTHLKQVEEDLRRASRAKDDFLGMLAHELRNPLAPVLNGLHILRLSDEDQQTTEQVRAMMERQLRHMSKLVENLLDVTRLTRGKVHLNAQRLDLGRLVQTVVQDYRSTLERAGLTLDVATPEQPVWVVGDATRLTQALNHLLENTTKFTDSGGRVTVQVALGPNRQEAVLTVRDTGIGIEPDMLPYLFDTFSQADRSLHRTRGGLGLGLALVRSLIELHGGRIEARSEGAGQGSEMIVHLPLEGEPPALVEMPANTTPMGERLRVLIVEDNRDAAESLRTLLELLGNEVRVTHSGTAGVQEATAWRPDVVLCDIGLPGLDGWGVASELRRQPPTARTRLIAITGYGRDEDRRHSHEVGFDYHLIKPVDPELLQNLLTGMEQLGERESSAP